MGLRWVFVNGLQWLQKWVKVGFGVQKWAKMRRSRGSFLPQTCRPIDGNQPHAGSSRGTVVYHNSPKSDHEASERQSNQHHRLHSPPNSDHHPHPCPRSIVDLAYFINLSAGEMRIGPLFRKLERAVAVSGVFAGVLEESSGKISGKLLEFFPESRNAMNSRISGTGKGKPAGNIGSTLA